MTGVQTCALPIYDNMNYINLRKYYSETLSQSAISVIHLENGKKTELLNTRIPVEDRPIYLRLYIEGRKSWFEWSYDNETYEKIGRIFDTTKFSDEYCKCGEFTGTMVGITCADTRITQILIFLIIRQMYMPALNRRRK